MSALLGEACISCCAVHCPHLATLQPGRGMLQETPCPAAVLRRARRSGIPARRLLSPAHCPQQAWGSELRPAEWALPVCTLSLSQVLSPSVYTECALPLSRAGVASSLSSRRTGLGMS